MEERCHLDILTTLPLECRASLRRNNLIEALKSSWKGHQNIQAASQQEKSQDKVSKLGVFLTAHRSKDAHMSRQSE